MFKLLFFVLISQSCAGTPGKNISRNLEDLQKSEESRVEQNWRTELKKIFRIANLKRISEIFVFASAENFRRYFWEMEFRLEFRCFFFNSIVWFNVANWWLIQNKSKSCCNMFWKNCWISGCLFWSVWYRFVQIFYENLVEFLTFLLELRIWHGEHLTKFINSLRKLQKEFGRRSLQIPRKFNAFFVKIRPLFLPKML